MPISQNLKDLQDIRNMTTAELAEKSGVPEATITKIRTGVTKSPTSDTLQRLAKALNCSINDLTDSPSVDDEEIRALLPKKLPTDPEEIVNLFCSTLKNQRMANDRTCAELRKDRNFWRKFAVICIGCIIPVVLATLVIVLVMYWDLSHPTEGNILLNYALEHYNLK